MKFDSFIQMGSVTSLKKSIREIEDYLSGQDVAEATGTRGELHMRLEELALRWYKEALIAVTVRASLVLTTKVVFLGS